jgi:hypothetical protein
MSIVRCPARRIMEDLGVSRSFCSPIAVLTIAVCLTGCSSFGERCSMFLQCRADKKAHKKQLRADELQALKMELEAERRALQAEREFEMARRTALADKRSCQFLSQYDESVRTNVGLDLDQRVRIGQMQVNMPELQRLMATREEDYAHQIRAYEALKQHQKQQAFQAWEQAQKAPLCACAQPTCGAHGAGCELPHHGCQCKKCGLPFVQQEQPFMAACARTQPFRQAPAKPIQQPLLATEIPFMLPVNLEVGVAGAYLGESQVRRLPYHTAESYLKQPCGKCKPCQVGQPCPSCVPPPPMQPPPAPAPDLSRRGRQPSQESAYPQQHASWESEAEYDSPPPAGRTVLAPNPFATFAD